MGSLTSPVLVCATALLLDVMLGEPRRWHPLVSFGRLAERVERRLNKAGKHGVLRGAFGVLILVTPLLLVSGLVVAWLPSWLLYGVEILVLWLALSLRGLIEHARAVEEPLRSGDLEQARVQVGRIVSRKTESLDEAGVASAASESVLENGADAVFASLFWFLVAGLQGVVLHRAINTLDAMWGYRNDRFLRFGRIAARLDDLLNWVPARLTALTYTLVGQTATGWNCWRTQAAHWDSPNAGPVMAAGAGALGVTLGGPTLYATGMKDRSWLGTGPGASAATIGRAVALVRRSVWFWLIALILVVLLETAIGGSTGVR